MHTHIYIEGKAYRDRDSTGPHLHLHYSICQLHQWSKTYSPTRYCTEHVSPKLQFQSSLCRLLCLEEELGILQAPTEMPTTMESSIEEAISSMSEGSAGSQNSQQAVPNGLSALNAVSSDDEDGSGQDHSAAGNGLRRHERREDEAGSTSGASADSSDTAASVPAEPLPGFHELIEKVST